MVSETDRFLKNLLTKGMIYERKVYRENSGSGKINVHKSLIGKKYRIILMPMDEEGELDGKRPKPDLVSLKEEALEAEIKTLKEKIEDLEKNIENPSTSFEEPKPSINKIDFTATGPPQ